MWKNIIEIKVLNKIEEFEKIEKHVDSLVQENNGRVLYLTFDYLVSWLHAFANDNRSNELHILVAAKNDRIIGLCPMILQPIKWRNIISLKVMKFIGEGLWGYADFLISNEFRNEVIEAFLDFLLRRSKTWDRLEIGPIPEDSPNIDGIRRYSCKINKKARLMFKEITFNDAPYIDIKAIGDFDTYKKGKLKRNLLPDIKRRIRKLNELGALEYGKLTESNQLPYLDSYLDIFFHLHQKEWKDSRFVRIPQYKNLYRELAERALKKGFFEFSYLRLNENIIACHYGLVIKRRLYQFTPVYDVDFSKYSPGKVHMYHIILDLFNRGLEEFDLMNGSEDYKLMWSTGIRNRYYFYVHNWKSTSITFCDSIMTRIVKLLKIILNGSKLNRG
jgi:hypothetical protein